MKTRFLHCADIHLGYKQYNSPERGNDFARAFFAVIDAAILEQVDFVILAGDLFHKRAIDALTLNQAVAALEKLQDAGIPCIAIEGNHERSHYEDYLGWMDFLAIRRLLTLLTPQFEEGKPQLTAYKKRAGSYIDPVPGLRVHGLQYVGSSSHSAIAAYADALADLPNDDIEFSIFMAHAGVEGVLAEEAGGLSHRELSVLKPHVDYLAMGHIHKPFEHEGWIYNPGSPETCSVSEAEWPQRGYFLVSVYTDSVDATDAEEGHPKHRAHLFANPRRTFIRLRLKVDLLRTPEALYAECEQFLARQARDNGVRRLPKDKRPVVELVLTGVLPFDRSGLEMDKIERMVEEIFEPMVAQVKNMTRATEFSVSTDAKLNRRELERQIVTELLELDARYSEKSEEWAELAMSIKALAVDGAAPETIIDEIAGALKGSSDGDGTDQAQ
jgi:exonuclease SbcD